MKWVGWVSSWINRELKKFLLSWHRKTCAFRDVWVDIGVHVERIRWESRRKLHPLSLLKQVFSWWIIRLENWTHRVIDSERRGILICLTYFFIHYWKRSKVCILTSIASVFQFSGDSVKFSNQILPFST